MVGSTPFLLSYSSSSLSFIQLQDDEDDEQITSINSVVEECIGELNWTQLFQVVLVSFAWFFDGQQTFITIFTDAQPSWHCTTNQDGCESSTTKSATMCNLPNDTWSWDEPIKTSIISEWDLECVGSFITGLPASMFFVGSLIGGLVLATLADSWLGRKKMLFFSCLLMSLSSFLASFSANIWIYSILKFLCGFGRVNIGTAAIVLASELVSRKWRGQVDLVAKEMVINKTSGDYCNGFRDWEKCDTLTTLSGISSVVSTIEVVGVQIVFELVSFICACTAYDVLVIYGTELFPTCVRNSALSLVRQAGVLGGTLCPMLVAIGRGNKFLCYGVFGLAIGCSGLFSVCLPETKGKAFCDTIHEEESKQEVVESFIK
ncbi:hypothetical protein AHAS_Ahas12G0217200 [Arachis hypogaea]|uniref:Major facilitator superfamily (MFS) profile domain-containing protein n=1 Tax=Arachis hypogaea TaxID=3818 RepID=A0A445E8Q9_ARAHY|nr:hypothetical protein Ahy_A02g006112 [Arachis hypogaea]